ncbi:MAG: hypothetical protein SGJ03_00455 [Alphaproteobacteria bacterium]|nr:hypothetical protein [Alphaproteobacteria bacterium]
MKWVSALTLSFCIFAFGVANAAPVRDALAGFDGVAFGTPFDDVKKQRNAEEGTNNWSPGETWLNTKNEQLFGEALSVQYKFDKQGLFSIATAKVDWPLDDMPFCASRFAKLVDRFTEGFGEPDTTDDDKSVVKVIFKFKDGALIRLQHSSCVAYVSFRSPSESVLRD